LEALDDLCEAILVGGWDRSGGRIYAGDAAHIL
jgi:hypothetical protein